MRYPPLLIAIFFVAILKPFADRFGMLGLTGGFFLLLPLLAIIYAFRQSGTFEVCLGILGAIVVTLRFSADHWQNTSLLMVSQGLTFIIMVSVMIAILFEVLRAQTVSTDLVIGAVCLYLVIGLAWTFLYYSVYLFSPGAIFVAAPANLTPSASETRFTELLYYSFSALTTIGSSGEEPLTTMTRQLAVVESAMGQLYLAVLISRLVGFHTSTQAKK
jgi:voltage-gated potassium channel